MNKLLKMMLLTAALLAGFATSGCKTPEPENESARPWNSPRGWESGIPGFSNEGR